MNGNRLVPPMAKHRERGGFERFFRFFGEKVAMPRDKQAKVV